MTLLRKLWAALWWCLVRYWRGCKALPFAATWFTAGSLWTAFVMAMGMGFAHSVLP